MTQHDTAAAAKEAAREVQQGAKQVARAAQAEAQEAEQELTSMAHEVEREAHRVVDSATQEAEAFAGVVEEQLSALLTDQLNQVAGRASGIAQALRHTSDSLKEQEESDLARYADQIAEQCEGVATHLKNGDMATLRHDLEGFAQREPTLFVGSALAAGLLLGRFLKSSAPAGSGAAPQRSNLTYPPVPTEDDGALPVRREEA